MTVISLSIENYLNIIQDKNSLIIIDFGADWCGPCKDLSPLFDSASEKNIFREQHEKIPHIIFAKVDVDKNPEMALLFNINSIPALIGINNGNLVFQHQGNISASLLEDKIQDLRNSLKI